MLEQEFLRFYKSNDMYCYKKCLNCYLLLCRCKELTFSDGEIKSMAMSSFLLFPLLFFLTLVALQGDSLPHGYVQEY